MIIKRRIQMKFAVLFCLLLFSGCGESQETVDILSSTELQETETEWSEQSEESEKDIRSEQNEASVEEDSSMEEPESEILLEIPAEENGMLELYADGDIISIPEELMVARVSLQGILSGNPILYDRFRTDGWVFEWLETDNHRGDGYLKDGVLVVSREDNPVDAQIIQVEAEEYYDAYDISIENKFEYADVNFDEIPDLLICTGLHGNQCLVTYYCFLQTENGFVEAPTFTEIANPAIDTKNRLILSQWRNSAASHSWAEYKCQDHTYVQYRELCEDVDLDSGEEIWIWTVNGEEIARSDELNDSEIWDLIYSEKSEWGIAGDRWRTLYNSGLTADYSIYSEP